MSQHRNPASPEFLWPGGGDIPAEPSMQGGTTKTVVIWTVDIWIDWIVIVRYSTQKTSCRDILQTYRIL